MRGSVGCNSKERRALIGRNILEEHDKHEENRIKENIHENNTRTRPRMEAHPAICLEEIDEVEFEVVFLFQKAAVYKCNMAGKPATVTRVVDSMTGNLRSTRAEATDVANVVLYGSDAILLGVETLRGLYPVETISIVGKIYAEAEKVFNQDMYLKKTVKYVGEPMTHLESIASSVVRAAIKVKASVIICLTSSGRGARLIAKYRPTIPNLSVVIPRLKTNQLRWSFSGAFEAESTGATNEYVLKVALDHGKSAGVIKSHNRVVVCQKVGDTSMVKIIELED
ncbi:hypothetical protein AgCh_025887 [Apium graveolens]